EPRRRAIPHRDEPDPEHGGRRHEREHGERVERGGAAQATGDGVPEDEAERSDERGGSDPRDEARPGRAAQPPGHGRHASAAPRRGGGGRGGGGGRARSRPPAPGAGGRGRGGGGRLDTPGRPGRASEREPTKRRSSHKRSSAIGTRGSASANASPGDGSMPPR